MRRIALSVGIAFFAVTLALTAQFINGLNQVEQRLDVLQASVKKVDERTVQLANSMNAFLDESTRVHTNLGTAVQLIESNTGTRQ